MTMIIPDSEAVPHPLSRSDDFGTVFRWRGRFLRELNRSIQREFEDFWASGLWQGLVEKGWAPATRITSLQTARGGTVLEHDEIPFATYPVEWSFSMIKDAGLHLLKVAEHASDHGYELKDAHGYNIVFSGCTPVFVDIGSFVRRSPDSVGWVAEREFRNFFLTTLRIWRSQGAFLARRLILGGEVISDDAALRLRFPVLRFPPKRASRMLARILGMCVFAQQASEKEMVEKHGRALGGAFNWMRRARIPPFKSTRVQQLRRAIELIEPERRHAARCSRDRADHNVQSAARAGKILDLVGSLRVRTVMNIGGSENEFSLLLSKLPAVDRVLSLDADHRALDLAYRRLRSGHPKMHTISSDFMAPLPSVLGIPQADRLRVDAVVVLGQSHLLLLDQKYNVHAVLDRLTALSSGFLLFEFMPSELWAEHGASPLPEWHTRGWFREAFARHCKEIQEFEMEENRILFLGRTIDSQ